MIYVIRELNKLFLSPAELMTKEEEEYEVEEEQKVRGEGIEEDKEDYEEKEEVRSKTGKL